MGLASNLKNPSTLITSIVMLVIAVSILAQALPTVITAVINISQVSNLGFASFFEANGIILLALGAAVLLGVLGVLGIGKSKR